MEMCSGVGTPIMQVNTVESVTKNVPEQRKRINQKRIGKQGFG